MGDGGYKRFSKRGVTLTAEVLAGQNNRKVLKKPSYKRGRVCFKSEKFPSNLIHCFCTWLMMVGGWLVMQNGEIQEAVKVSPPQQTALTN